MPAFSMFFTPPIGRFMTRDTWDGDGNRPLSFNRWNYVFANPVNATDPSGNIPQHCLHIDPSNWVYIKDCAGYYALPTTSTFSTLCPTAGTPNTPSGPQSPNTGWPTSYNGETLTEWSCGFNESCRENRSKTVWGWLCGTTGWWSPTKPSCPLPKVL